MTLVRFTPQDSLFFRDGRPYDKGESSQTGVASGFPPAPPTIVGAIRAGLARSMGWKSGGWDAKLRDVVGDGSVLGPLSFRGPVLMRNDECLFPVPANLLVSVDKDDVFTRLLSPSAKIECDLGRSTELPAIINDEASAKGKSKQGWWITTAGQESLLQGKLPDQACLVHRRELWCAEPRVSIYRSPKDRVTVEGGLYSPSHMRLKDGVTLAVEVNGMPRDLASSLSGRAQPVGGEARVCWLDLIELTLPFPKRPDLRPIDGRFQYSVTFLTPADAGKPPCPGEQGFAGLPGKVVSACIPRPSLIGGWDSPANKPLPLRPHLAPGSTIFLEAELGDEASVTELHGRNLGGRPSWGFGLAAIGEWPRRSDGSKE